MVDQAAIVAGSDRHLSYFPDHPADRWPLANLEARLLEHLQRSHPERVVVLTSGDPLFFGLGRQLLQALPAEALTFHPHVSSIQLAFSRIKLPWQEATLISAHGRSLERLATCLKRGQDLIAVLTDSINTPAAIARLVQSLDLPTDYGLWICENLGGEDERVQRLSLTAAEHITVSPLNVVILQRLETPVALQDLPLLGIPDQAFLSFPDRPGLMTKRPVRIQIMGELALQPQQVIWDVGAGTGSVSIEVARLVPEGQVWAIERSTMGSELIRQNVARFATSNVMVVQGNAPQALAGIPAPHRVFIGGSQGQLPAILDHCAQHLLPQGRILVALATLESLAEITQWLQQHPDWQGQFQQLALQGSVAVGPLTRWAPLNPVTLVRLTRSRSE
jgi:precorrin-6Y C5,15-methyltransferase (decarboxylating)